MAVSGVAVDAPGEFPAALLEKLSFFRGQALKSMLIDFVEDGIDVSLDVLTDSLALSQIRRRNTHK
jgi:hypothetical protein